MVPVTVVNTFTCAVDQIIRATATAIATVVTTGCVGGGDNDKGGVQSVLDPLH